MRVTRAVQTSPACPSQWDAWTNDGTYLYLRYRGGHGTVNRDDVDGPLVSEFHHGGPLAGSITLDEFCERAGIGLEAPCASS